MTAPRRTHRCVLDQRHWSRLYNQHFGQAHLAIHDVFLNLLRDASQEVDSQIQPIFLHTEWKQRG